MQQIFNSYRNEKVVVSEVSYDATWEGLPQDTYGRAVIVVNKEEQTIAMETVWGHAPMWDTAIQLLYINKPFRRLVKKFMENQCGDDSFYSIQTVYHTEADWCSMTICKVWYTTCNGAKITKVCKELLDVDEDGCVRAIEPLSIEDYCLLMKSCSKGKGSISYVLNYLRDWNLFKYVKPGRVYDDFDCKPPTWEEMTDL